MKFAVRQADKLMYQAKDRKDHVVTASIAAILPEMDRANQQKAQILIVDDSAMNRAILTSILGEDYCILEAENGRQCMQLLHEQTGQVALVLLHTAYEIARWHHERWDGRGYPDGLKGDEIPISAQIVSVADVYDALTSERCYKPPYSHEQAVQMILNGECGAFNPLLLECLKEVQSELKTELRKNYS